MNVTFLGTGTSHGIPVPTCTCPVCTSSDPRDNRYRSSVMIQQDDRMLVIDTGPEFRLQALRAHIMHIDAVLYTHTHADHFYGIDDLRMYANDKPLPVYGNQAVSDDMHRRFPYVIHAQAIHDGLPHLVPTVLPSLTEVEIAGFPVMEIPIHHGGHIISAYRIGDLVYATDCSGIDAPSLQAMLHPSVLVIGALRYRPHPTHFSIDQAIQVSEQIGAKRTYFIHMCHDISHQKLCDELQSAGRTTILPSYDMLSIEV